MRLCPLSIPVREEPDTTVFDSAHRNIGQARLGDVDDVNCPDDVAVLKLAEVEADQSAAEGGSRPISTCTLPDKR